MLNSTNVLLVSKIQSICSANGRSSPSCFSSCRPAPTSSWTTFSQLAIIFCQSLIKVACVKNFVSKTIRKRFAQYHDLQTYTKRLTIHSCEKNYGPSVRDRRDTRDGRSDGQSVDILTNGMAAGADSVDDGAAIQSSPLQPVSAVNLAIGTGLYPDTTLATRSITTPDVPYSDGSDPTCTDDSSVSATTTSSDTTSFWPLPTICIDTPPLCVTGPFPWTIDLDNTKSPRMITPAPQTAHRERPQGWLLPPYPQLATPSSQTGHVGSTGANPNQPIPLSTGLVPAAHKVINDKVVVPTQDPQAARLERPDLNLDIPRHGRVRRALPSPELALEAVKMELDARAKIPKPQPQTARAMATLGVDLGGPQLAGPDNGHPVRKLSNRAERAAPVHRREDDEQTTNEDEDRDTSTDSIWDSHANHVRGTADGFMVALMAATLSALLLVIIL